MLYYFTLSLYRITDSKTKGKQITKRNVDMRRLSRSRFPSFNWLFFFLIAMKTLLDITSAFVGENSNFFTPEMLQGKPICEVVYLCFFKLHYKIIGFHSTKFVFCVFWSLFLYMYNIIASDVVGDVAEITPMKEKT